MWGNLLSAATNLFGGLFASNQRRQEAATQRHYLENQTQIRVRDAQRAGVHPIYALGAPTMNYAPVGVGDPLGAGIREAGQDISRAVNSTSSQNARVSAFQAAAQALSLEKGGLENELLKAQIAKMRLQTNPAPPTPFQQYGIPGQGETAIVEPGAIKEKAERKNWDATNPSQEVFAVPDVGFARTPGGGYMPVPSDEVKQRIEDNEIHEWMHYFRNNLFPTFKPPFAAPEGKAWVYDPVRGYHLYNLREKRYEHLDYERR